MSGVGDQIKSAIADAVHARDIAPLVHCPPQEREAIRGWLRQDELNPDAAWNLMDELGARWRGVDAGRPWMAVKP